MKPIKYSLLSLLMLAFLTACGGGGSSSNQDVKTDYKKLSNNTMSDPNYTLPLMPNKEENDRTLLGVDSNENGVRDDVEIYIYENYQTYNECIEEVTQHYDEEYGNYTSSSSYCDGKEIKFHPIVREIAMQQARAWQIIIQDPSRALEFEKYEGGAGDCEAYFKYGSKKIGEPLLLTRFPNNKIDLREIQFNTKQRLKAYLEYDGNLGGHVFSLSKDYRVNCDFNITKLLQDYPVESYGHSWRW